MARKASGGSSSSNEENLGAGGLAGSSGPMSDVRARFAVDTAQMEKLVKGFSSIKNDIKWMHQNLDGTIRKVNALADALHRASSANVGTGGATGTTTTSNAVAQAVNVSQANVQRSGTGGTAANVVGTAASVGGFFKNFRGGLSGAGGALGAIGGGGGAVGGGAALAGAAGGPAGILAALAAQSASQMADRMAKVITGAIAQIDKRTDEAYGGMLARDRLGLVYQQMYGVTNNQYANQFRKPLQGFMLGEGGISTLLGMQARTGLTAQGQASGVEALRIATGMGYTTSDVTRMIETLASPTVNNRLTMTAGTGIYGPGGQQRSIMDVVQGVVRSAGLTNERLVESGMQQGSITRARLTQMGIPEDMQDMILQYARSNIQFQKKTGGRQGMYNPQDVEQRDIMGINKTFAIERERTIRETEERDERFYRRQANDYAQLERNTQRLISSFAALEDRLSGIIGTRISNRNKPEMFFLRQLGGFALDTAKSIIPGGGGDGTETPSAGANQTVKFGYNNKKVPIKTLENSQTFSKLNPKFKERLMQMMAENPNVGIGQGYRSAADQKSLFLSRYTRTDEDTGVRWNGSFWKKNAGVADAAPPGLSMHEIGLAVDLVGDLEWVQANASRFGLKTFANVNNEPWHVQPAELPNGRSGYEKAGAPWGTIPGATSFDPDSQFNGKRGGMVISDSYITGRGSGGKNAKFFTQTALAELIKASQELNRSTLGGTNVSGGAGGRVRLKSGSSKTPSGRTLSGAEVAKLFYSAGFRGKDLVKAVAIAGRESSFRTNAHNPNSSTGDDSYGLMQINMIGALGPDRRRRLNLKSNEELFDPAVNARAAYWLYQAGKNSFYHWGEYKGMDSAHNTDIKRAKKYVQSAGISTGDGMARTSSTGSVRIDGGQNINIAPNIYIQATGNSTVDYHRAAKEAARVVTEELRLAALRSS